jgi:hypothetical protein
VSGVAQGTLAQTLDTLCTGPESIPLEIAGSREFVMVTIPGSTSPEPLRFAVDTGGNTPGLMVTRSALQRLGFTSEAQLPRHIAVGGRDIPLPLETTWVVLDDDSADAKFERATRKGFAVGQVGAGFLSHFVVCIDPGRARLGLGVPTEYDLDPGETPFIKMLMMSGPNGSEYPFVHVVLFDRGDPIGGYGLLLDTGATTSMLDRNKLEYQRDKHPSVLRARGSFGDADMIGGTWPEEVIAVPDVALHTIAQASAAEPPGRRSPEPERVIDLGPARFVDRPTGTWDKMFGSVRATLGSHGALANDVLLGYRIVIDYPHERLFVQPSPRPLDASASAYRVGVSLRFGDDGCPVVRQVTDTNAPETRAQIQVGDVIASIDGKDACAMWHHEVQAALAGPPGATKRLSLRRDGREENVELAVADLLSVISMSAASGRNVGMTPGVSSIDRAPEQAEAEQASKAWLAILDADDFAGSWAAASTLFRQHLAQPEWVTTCTELRKRRGNVASRALRSAAFRTQIGKGSHGTTYPPGDYFVLEYETAFDSGEMRTEEIVAMKDVGGGWRVTGYHVK